MTYNSIALVDLSYLCRKAWHAYESHSEVNHAARSVLEELARIRDSVDHVILCCDSPPYWRTEIYSQYKAHREKPSDGYVSQLRWLKERLDADGYQLAKAQTFEADDVIATLAAQLSQECDDVRIVGCDKDLAQCVNERVRMFVPAVGGREAEVWGPKEVFEKHGVPPLAIVDWLALQGDQGDNVPGIKGIGGKTAAKLLDDHAWDMGRLLESLQQARQNGEKMSAKEKLIVENQSIVTRARKLVQLRMDVPVDAAELLTKKEPRPLVEVDIEGPVEELELTEVPKEGKDEQTVGYEPEQTTSIVRARGDWSLSLQPQNYVDAFKLAKVLHNSSLYRKFPTESAIFAVLMRGRELGLGVTTALDNFHVIEGKPAASAHLIMALTQRHPDCEYLMLVESTGERAVYETKHRRQPKPIRMEYTIQEAKEAGLLSPSRSGKPKPWHTVPKAMLRKTAGVMLCRAVYQEATCGLYCIEEHGLEVE